MSKFFTGPIALLLAYTLPALASPEMPAVALLPGLEPSGSPGGPPSLLPIPLEADRFAPLAKKSPFTLASTTEENADFAKDLVLAGYFRMDGKDFVLVANRTQPARLMVGTEPSASAQGLILLKVERDPSGDPAKLRALVRKGTETALLKYETPASASAAQPAPGQPAIPGQPAVLGQPQPGQAAPGTPGQAPAQNTPVIRRRVIPIPPATSR